jgi:hypothetical protein
MELCFSYREKMTHCSMRAFRNAKQDCNFQNALGKLLKNDVEAESQFQ